MTKRPFSLLLAILALGGCAGAGKPATKAEAAKTIRVEGELGKSPFGCPMVRTADGGKYSLAREIEGSSPGQQVWVEGYLVEGKGCMPGRTLMPRRAGLMPETLAAKAAVKATKKTPVRPASGGGPSGD